MTNRPQNFFSNASQSVTGFLSAIGFLRPPVMQVAAICHRQGATGLEVLLITSLGTGQWIVPKGWPKKNRSSSQTALEEAYEEAGIKGIITDEPIGEYHYQKENKSGVQLNCVASVYAIAVTDTVSDFPEAGRRKLAWLPPHEAAERVSNPELAKLLEGFKPSAKLQ